MYLFTLGLHNIVRWITLILLVVVTVRAFLGWFGNREWSDRDRKIGSYTTIAMDIQLLLGLLLYVVLSPITKTAFQDMSAAMAIAELRFFVMEHALFMVLAVVFAHLGSALSKRADGSRTKFQRAAIFFGLALFLVLIGIPWGRPLLPGMG